LAYKFMFRSNLEYCTSVWSPHTEKLKSKWEQVQRRATRYVTNRYHNTSSVSAMLNHLQLPILEHRRNLNRITILLSVQEAITHYNIKLYPPGQTIINTVFTHMQ
jgi:hypothetical protein